MQDSVFAPLKAVMTLLALGFAAQAAPSFAQNIPASFADQALTMGGTEMSSSQRRCDLDLRVRGDISFRGPHSRGYDSRDSSLHREHSEITVRHSGRACSYVVKVSADSGDADPQMRHRGDTLSYTFGRAGDESSHQNGTETVFYGQFGRREGAEQLQLSVAVPTGQSVRAGRYRDQLTVSLYEDRNGALIFIKSRKMGVKAHVPARISASIGETASAGLKTANVDFGVLQTGLKRSVNFAVDANTGYNVRLESEHDGGLKHEHSDALIPYDVSIDGMPVALGRQGRHGAMSSSRIGETVHDLTMQIRKVEYGAVAGAYADRLTIVVTAD